MPENLIYRFPQRNIIVRNYISPDYDQVSSLWEQTGVGGKQRGDNNMIIMETIAKGGRLLVIEDVIHDNIVGTCWMTNDGRRIHLHHLCVKEEYRGKGYAKVLLELSLEYVKSLGLQVKIEVEQINKAALELYKKYGFTYLGDYDVYIIRKIKDIITSCGPDNK